MKRNSDISEADLAEVERRQLMPNVPGQWVTLSVTERDTLCATIRRLRTTVPPSPTVDEVWEKAIAAVKSCLPQREIATVGFCNGYDTAKAHALAAIAAQRDAKEEG